MSEYNSIPTVMRRLEELEQRMATVETAPRLGRTSIYDGVLRITDQGNLTVKNGEVIADAGTIISITGGGTMYRRDQPVVPIASTAASVSNLSGSGVSIGGPGNWGTVVTTSLAVPEWATFGIVIAQGSVNLTNSRSSSQWNPRISYNSTRIVISTDYGPAVPATTIDIAELGGPVYLVSQMSAPLRTLRLPVSLTTSIGVGLHAQGSGDSNTAKGSLDVSVIWSTSS